MTNRGAEIGARFPRTQRYLDALSDGLATHPKCLSKASLLHSALTGHDVQAFATELPGELQSLLRAPPPAGLWIPAVHLIAIVHAIIDVHYPSEKAILAWGARRTSALADSAFYRALLRVSSPRVFFTMTARVNRLFQRGTTFEMEKLGAEEAIARLTFPPNLHDRPSLLGTVAMCDKIVELTGGRPRGTELAEITPTHGLFHCRWELS